MEPRPLRILRNFRRSRQIASVLLNHGFGDVAAQLGLRRYLQWGRKFLFWREQKPLPNYTRAQRIRMTLEDLGATFIKFGQVISTRPDLVPADVIGELSLLQENVPPFPWEQVEETLRNQLGRPSTELFQHIDHIPLAAGSLGQVHTAVHHNGSALAVKIRRPQVVRQVESDLALMEELALLLVRHLPETEVFDPVGLVQHFSRTIRREMNYSREGRTTNEFRRLFQRDATLYVPRVYDELTTDAVLTMEFIDGVHVNDLTALQKLGVLPSQLAANGARIYMKQAFELGIFHGDPHPGNIRVLPDGSIALLDYGMVGRLENEKREQLIDLLLAVSHRDVPAAVRLIVQVGQPWRPIDMPLLQADMRDFIETWYGIPLEQVRVGQMLTDFTVILSQHGIRCPADLMLLIRALVTLEGVGRDLDPRFNLADHLAPFVERLVRERYNPASIFQRLLHESGEVLGAVCDLPGAASRTLDKLSRNEIRFQFEHRGLEHLITEIDRSSNRIVIGLVMSALILASALIIRGGTHALGFSIPLFVLSSLLGAWLIYGIFRSGRL